MHRYKGSVTNAADVEKVFEGGDVEGVIISLGGKTKDVGPTMLTDGTATVIAAICVKSNFRRTTPSTRRRPRD